MMVDRRTVTVPKSWAVLVLIAGFFGLGALAMIGIAVDRAIDKLNVIADSGQQQAERNTELLTIECDIETGLPKLVARKDYVNSRRLLVAHCTREKRQAEKVGVYIDTIKDDAADQLEITEGNILSKLDEVKAAVERRPAPVVVRVPIPRPAPASPATVAPRAGGSPPPPAVAPSITSPPPSNTSSTCPAKGKRPEHCK